MGRSLVSSFILGRVMRFYISAESLTPGLDLEVQMKDFHREILGHVLPDTETYLTKIFIHGIDHQSLLALYQKRVESDGRAECAKCVGTTRSVSLAGWLFGIVGAVDRLFLRHPLRQRKRGNEQWFMI